MADVSANSTTLYESGTAEKVVLYLVKNVDTNDTIGVSAKFSKVKAAVSVPAGDPATGDVCAVAGTTVTIDTASLTDDAVFVLVVGNAAV